MICRAGSMLLLLLLGHEPDRILVTDDRRTARATSGGERGG
jgi:hypothetical protein